MNHLITRLGAILLLLGGLAVNARAADEAGIPATDSPESANAVAPQAPVNPAPVTPALSTPAPVTPAPVTPAPVAPSISLPPPQPATAPPAAASLPETMPPQPQLIPPPPPALPPPPPNMPPPGTPPPPSGYWVPQSSYPPPEGYPPEAPRYRYGRRWSNPTSEMTDHLGEFSLGGLDVIQGSIHQLVPFVAWNPRFVYRSGGYLGFSLGGTSVTNALSSDVAVLEGQFLFGTRLGSSPLGVEGGAGLQQWGGLGGSYPLLSGSVYLGFDHGWLERVFVGYGGYFMSDFFTSEVKVGIGLSF